MRFFFPVTQNLKSSVGYIELELNTSKRFGSYAPGYAPKLVQLQVKVFKFITVLPFKVSVWTRTEPDSWKYWWIWNQDWSQTFNWFIQLSELWWPTQADGKIAVLRNKLWENASHQPWDCFPPNMWTHPHILWYAHECQQLCTQSSTAYVVSHYEHSYSYYSLSHFKKWEMFHQQFDSIANSLVLVEWISKCSGWCVLNRHIKEKHLSDGILVLQERGEEKSVCSRVTSKN